MKKRWKLYIWRVLEGIAIVITIFITPAALYFQYQSLQEQKILGAWQLITTKARGNSGKIEALEFLNSKGVPLVGVDLSDAYLGGVNLNGANLLNADFTGATLQGAKFHGAILQGAKFNGANLWDAKFEGAELLWADFEGALLRNTNFEGVKRFYSAKFNGAFTVEILERRRKSILPTAPEGYEFVVSKAPSKDGKIFIELVKK